MKVNLRTPAFSDSLQTVVSGIFDAKEVRNVARAFALASGCFSRVDRTATVKLFLRGEWETADGHLVFLTRDRFCKKAGQRWYYVKLSGPDGLELCRVEPATGEDRNPRVLIREGSVTEHTKRVGKVPSA